MDSRHQQIMLRLYETKSGPSSGRNDATDYISIIQYPTKYNHGITCQFSPRLLWRYSPTWKEILTSYDQRSYNPSNKYTCSALYDAKNSQYVSVIIENKQYTKDSTNKELDNIYALSNSIVSIWKDELYEILEKTTKDLNNIAENTQNN